MADRGIDLQLPVYQDIGLAHLTTEGDLLMWEVEYDDGTYYRQDLGGLYARIDRSRLKAFRLVLGGDLILHAPPPAGADGYNLCWRRRVEMRGANESRRVVHMVAWVPMGPVVVVDMTAKWLRESPNFVMHLGDFQPPMPLPNEGEHFTTAGLATMTTL